MSRIVSFHFLFFSWRRASPVSKNKQSESDLICHRPEMWSSMSMVYFRKNGHSASSRKIVYDIVVGAFFYGVVVISVVSVWAYAFEELVPMKNTL